MNDFAHLPLFETPRAAGDAAPVVNFATPIALDPELPTRLARAQAEVALALPQLEEARARGEAARISTISRDLIEQVRAIHRLEALRLFPVIAHQINADPEAASALAQIRLEVSGYGRKVLRLLEDAERSGAIGTTNVRLAQSLWKRYSQESRERLYVLYPAQRE